MKIKMFQAHASLVGSILCCHEESTNVQAKVRILQAGMDFNPPSCTRTRSLLPLLVLPQGPSTWSEGKDTEWHLSPQILLY